MTAILTSIASDQIKSDPIAAEIDLETIYLGKDMDAICSVAIAAGDHVLIANAALPLKNREGAFRNWRKKQVLRLIRLDFGFKPFFENHDPTLWESIIEGEMPLNKVLEHLTDWRKKQVLELLQEDTNFQLFRDNAHPNLWDSIQNGKVPLATVKDDISACLRRVALNQAKIKIRASIRAAIQDYDGNDDRMILPGFIVILETGEVGLFSRRHAAIEWARDSGLAYLFGNFDKSSHRINYGSLSD